MSTQPEALRLADAMEELDAQFSHTGLCGEAAAELRRLALKQWVGMTDEEIHDLIYLSQKIDASNSPWFDCLGFYRAVEQALKEKNHG